MQVRWRFVEETESHPEAFTFVETVFPFQRDRHLIGTQDWEYKVGVGFTRGFAWGTGTFRRAFLKINNGLGLTTNATGLAPEIGVMMSF